MINKDILSQLRLIDINMKELKSKRDELLWQITESYNEDTEYKLYNGVIAKIVMPKEYKRESIDSMKAKKLLHASGYSKDEYMKSITVVPKIKITFK